MLTAAAGYADGRGAQVAWGRGWPGGEPLRLDVVASLARALAWHGLDLPRARALAAQAVAAARARLLATR